MLPALLLLALIVTACASSAHLLFGKRWVQLPLFWMAAAVGAGLTALLNLRFTATTPAPGGVPVLEVTLAAWLCLLIASRIRL